MPATFMSCPLQSGYHTCTYKYHATQRNFDGDQLQATEVQAIVHISCSSGEFNVASPTQILSANLYCVHVCVTFHSGNIWQTECNSLLYVGEKCRSEWRFVQGQQVLIQLHACS